MEEIMVDGFATANEPLLVCQSAALQTTLGDRRRTYPKWQEMIRGDNKDSIDLLGLGYVKGAARTLTVHAILVLLLQVGVDIATAMPQLSKSITRVKVYNIAVATRIDQALLNAKLSSKGSIRKAWNCITWVGCLRQLQTTTGESDGLINRWNKMSAADNKFTGAKLMCVKVILSFEEATVDKMIAITQTYGWDKCPFTEVCRAPKSSWASPAGLVTKYGNSVLAFPRPPQT
jgi:hypothetical protein